ncbi:MAG: hypothetical protein Ta2E_07320 [Mycoplasmoidaceae bacterium]|nr:MAG: hypothetical protein Ta2E_07320 [Mycoplasmoidaceae bacterium]
MIEYFTCKQNKQFFAKLINNILEIRTHSGKNYRINSSKFKDAFECFCRHKNPRGNNSDLVKFINEKARTKLGCYLLAFFETWHR